MKKLFMILFILSCLTLLFARPADNRVTMSELREGREFQWVEQNSNFPNPSTGINFMCAVDENIVWAAGYDGGGTNSSYQIVTHTTNGGSSWTATQIDTAPTDGDAAMVYAVNDMKAWVPIHTGSPLFFL